MTLRVRATLVLALVALGSLVLGTLVVGMIRNAAEVRFQTTRVLYPAGEQVAELQLAFTDMERGVWGYAISEDPAFLTSYVTGQAQSSQALAELRTLLTGDGADLLPLLEQTSESWRQWDQDIAEPLISDVRSGGVDAARADIAAGNGRRAFSHVRSNLSLLEQAIDARLAESVDELWAINRRLTIALFVTALAAVVLTVGAAIAMVRGVLDPLDDLRSQMRRIARENDTVSPLRPGGPPEISALGRDAELLRQHLVSEIDATTEATEGLAQEGPAVAALSRLLRGPTAPRVPGYGVGVANLTAQGALAGDWWDVIPVTGGEAGGPHSGIEMCDVSGHDAGAGVVAARFKAALHVGLRNGVAAPEAVAQAAAIFTKTPEKFASYVLVELAAGALWHLNAGHNPPLLIRRAGTVLRLDPTGPLVTSLPGGRWSSTRTPLAAGDVLVMYTDGLVEARDGRGDELDEDQLIAWCRLLCAEVQDDPAGERAAYIAHGLLDRARERTADLRRDDVTVIVAVCE